MLVLTWNPKQHAPWNPKQHAPWNPKNAAHQGAKRMLPLEFVQEVFQIGGGGSGGLAVLVDRLLELLAQDADVIRSSDTEQARLRATLGQDAPHGRGVSDPSPCAPPRQAGKPGPIGHSRRSEKSPEVGRLRPGSLVGNPNFRCLDPTTRRVGGACLGKKQVGAGTDMRVFSAQPKAGTLPGDT